MFKMDILMFGYCDYRVASLFTAKRIIPERKVGARVEYYL